VDHIGRTSTGYFVSGDWGKLGCKQLVLATGGKSLPKSGSDGKGFEFARAFGHRITRRFPALVPLTLPKGDEICKLSGITIPATLRLHSGTGKRIIEITDSENIQDLLDSFQGIDRSDTLALKVGDQTSFGVFEGGHSKEDKISAVHFVRFPTTPEFRAHLDRLDIPAFVVIRHNNYQVQAPVSPEMRQEWLSDLRS